ncbi:DUF6223 family protein [Amycolatopsis sp. YIM 10]|uniref:DUF6223 family protein n=1 Tax=Amycolatopsis sp. YIM 10 TaxID=2653857 RepID=UPI00128FD917|nr:DUF6223 family protein [Amycolatopsis sp. YIM 10]QFU90356.1 hypothetical protein YIM_25910 [Amycolatopsis sp. YIM 10]
MTALLAADAYTLSSGRIGALAGGLLGLLGVVIGGFALARAWRRGAVIAVAAGVTGMAVGGLVVVTAEGGVGTGNGLGGGVVALVVGLLGAVLGGIALIRRSRSRTGSARPAAAVRPRGRAVR